MEFKKSSIFIFVLVFLGFIAVGNCIKVVNNFEQLGKHHCQQFPIQTLWRIATGTISQKYGEQYFDFDCYIRQFIRKDGLTIEESQNSNDQQDQEEQQSQDQSTKKQLQIDPIVTQYAEGLSQCLPQGVNSVQATYAIWRFFRYIVQNDYVYQWMRAKIRATLGYEAERPNSWMDGQNSAARLRLDKLFSNQFYEYVDKLMFKEFLYPLLRFFKQNTVIGLTGKATQSGKPIIFQSLETFNYLPKVFEPVIIDIANAQQRIFTYTIPGLPLLFAGSTSKIAWSFTGVLVDRTNIQQIETVGNKFYHHDTQQWLKLDSEQLDIPGVEDKVCKFMHCAYGTLYTKQDRQGKNEEYIIRWHEKQSKVRMLFNGLYQLILNNGILQQGESLQFPFNSIVLANQTGIYQYICQQFYPSYFLYPDMFGEPENLADRWISYPSKKIVVVSNAHLTTSKQQSYIKGQAQSPIDQQTLANFKSFKDKKFTLKSLLKFGQQISTTQQLKKQKELMVKIYRKVKFFYLPTQQHRKKCDSLISILQKWDNNLSNKKIAPIYILWDYFLKQYTFNYVSASKYGADIVKHKLITDNYWLNQMILWEKGTSYGQCDSDQYQRMKDQVNGTGHNSSCYLNILRAINTTKQILSDKYNGDFSKINLDDFTHKQYKDNAQNNFKGGYLQEAFGVLYSRNVMFSAEIDNPNIVYYQSYLEKENQVNLREVKVKEEVNDLDEQL